MTKRFFFFLLTCFILLGCSRNPTAKKYISPRAINFENISFYMTKDSIRSLYPNLNCKFPKSSRDTCVWKLSEMNKKGILHNIEMIHLFFKDDILNGFLIHYHSMLDVEYKNLVKSIRGKYGTVGDTTRSEWQYDSLRIIIKPNQRPHWTGKITMYEPTLEFVEYLILTKE